MRLTRQHFKLIAEAVDRAAETRQRISCEAENPSPDPDLPWDPESWSDGFDKGYEAGQSETVMSVVVELQRALEETNDNFDRDRFGEACVASRTKYLSLRALNESAERINREKELAELAKQGEDRLNYNRLDEIITEGGVLFLDELNSLDGWEGGE